LPEELVWTLFKCLALGCVVMDFGNEDLIGVKWNGVRNHGDVVHFDKKRLMVPILHPSLKSVAEHDGIVLVASNDNHRKTPVCKVNQT
jgi:hypothetical protein